jgi:YVTN family beta-propeller protein
MVSNAGQVGKRNCKFEVLEILKMENKKMEIRIRGAIFCLYIAVFFTVSCDDMEDKLKPANTGLSNEPTQLYVLSEGLFNMNNSTLARYDLTLQTLVPDFFLATNKRGLGDTANDMGMYGSKIYVVVNVSSQVEVLDAATGKSLKRIAMFDARGVASEPRFVDFHNEKAYVCSFDGSVAKIDTASLQIEATVQCGKNPDGICVTNNKLYVSNSGGLNFPNYDNTVSVIDLVTFTEIKKITVGVNPGKLLADSEGDVYVVSRGDYGANPTKLQRINSFTDELVESFNDIQALNFSIRNDTAYIYSFDYITQTTQIKVFDCKTEKLISENFITDYTKLTTPFGIDINPANGDVYITDSKSYTIWGDVLCFDRAGKLKFKLRDIGLNPKKILFK